MLLRLSTLLFGNPEDIDFEPAIRRLTPVDIRLYSPHDFEACRQLYILNEPNRFPAGILPVFETTLRDGSALFLVAERNGVVCGCGGVYIREGTIASAAWLCYGLIHPKYHGQGLGAAMLLARLSLLPADIRWAAMTTVPKSRGYYERFNFREFMKAKVTGDLEAPLHRVRLPSRTASRCEYLLNSAGIILTADSQQVPVKPAQQKAASVS